MEENKLAVLNVLTNEDIKKLIYTIRGKQVMLDSDVAMLYNYETKKINQAVKRNIDRFPERFCFQLTEDELEKMWSQFVTTFKFISPDLSPFSTFVEFETCPYFPLTLSILLLLVLPQALLLVL